MTMGRGVQYLATKSIVTTVAVSVMSAGLIGGTVTSVYKCDINNWLYQNQSQNWWQECNSELASTKQAIKLQNQLISGGITYENGVLKTNDGKIIDIDNRNLANFKISNIELSDGNVIAKKDGLGMSLEELKKYIEDNSNNNEQKLLFENGVLKLPGKVGSIVAGGVNTDTLNANNQSNLNGIANTGSLNQNGNATFKGKITTIGNQTVTGDTTQTGNQILNGNTTTTGTTTNNGAVTNNNVTTNNGLVRNTAGTNTTGGITTDTLKVTGLASFDQLVSFISGLISNGINNVRTTEY